MSSRSKGSGAEEPFGNTTKRLWFYWERFLTPKHGGVLFLPTVFSLFIFHFYPCHHFFYKPQSREGAKKNFLIEEQGTPISDF